MIADRLATVLFDGTHPRDPGLAKLLGIGPESASGARVDERSVLGLSPIFRGVNILGAAVAKCTPHIYRRLPGGTGGDKERDRSHPAWRAVVQWANPWMSAAELRDLLTSFAILRGNGCAYVDRDTSGTAIEFTPLLPDRTGMAIFGRKLSDQDVVPRGAEVMYWTMVGGELRTLLPENVLHIRGRSNNGVWGMDIVELMRETLGLAIAARDCGARFFGQGMLQSGVLYMPPAYRGPAAEETAKRFVEGIKKQSQGLGRAHKLLVIEEGAKYEKLSVDPEAAQALETREFTIRELANIVGCQPHKLGDTKRTSYASLEQANQEHLDDDVDPWLRRWEEALAKVALRETEIENDTHFIQCNRKALLRTNLSARSSHYASGRQWGYYSVNDIRRLEDLDPIGPDGDSYLVPANMVPADQAGAAFAEPPAGAGGEEGDGEEAAQLRQKVRELAIHEANRLTKRVFEEARRKAAKGPSDFLAFLESIDRQCQEPRCLRPLLAAVGEDLKRQLDEFTRPPHTAADLARNIEHFTYQFPSERIAALLDRRTAA